MPYKDLQRRRQCQRESKARSRRRQAIIRPLLGLKVFLCLSFPYFLNGNSRYCAPFLITRDLETITRIEELPEFGTTFIPLKVDSDVIGPLMDHDDD